jgi:cytochrome b
MAKTSSDHSKAAQCSVDHPRSRSPQPLPAQQKREQVWDKPTRLFHGLLILMMGGLFGTAYWGGAAMVWHIRLAYGLMSLLTFRLIWGFIGGYWSRWVRALEVWWPHFRHTDPSEPTWGHSRSGWASVFLFWGLILSQLATGLVADDQIATSGPLAAWVNENTSHWATIYHRDKGSIALWAWLGLHILAVLYYDIWRRQGLITAMWHGEKSDLK